MHLHIFWFFFISYHKFGITFVTKVVQWHFCGIGQNSENYVHTFVNNYLVMLKQWVGLQQMYICRESILQKWWQRNSYSMEIPISL